VKCSLIEEYVKSQVLRARALLMETMFEEVLVHKPLREKVIFTFGASISQMA
jgi:hypothetical protein